MSASRSAVPPVPPGGARVALVVDVDGVVSAVHPTSNTWGDEVTAGNLFGPVRVSPALCRRLDALAALPHVVALWLTSWPAASRKRMDPFPGRNWETLVTPEDAGQVSASSKDPDRLDWWKWDALRTWLEAHPGIRSLVWCEDGLAEPLWANEDDAEAASAGEARPRPHAVAVEPDDQPYLTTTAALIGARLAEMAVTGTLIAPETWVGLTRADLDRVEAAVAAAQPR